MMKYIRYAVGCELAISIRLSTVLSQSCASLAHGLLPEAVRVIEVRFEQERLVGPFATGSG
jgi:hypothetical protein